MPLLPIRLHINISCQVQKNRHSNIRPWRMKNSTYLRSIVRLMSWLSLSRAIVPSTRTALTLSLKLEEDPIGGCLSLRISKMLGWRRKATTLSLYATGTTGWTVGGIQLVVEGRGGGTGACNENITIYKTLKIMSYIKNRVQHKDMWFAFKYNRYVNINKNKMKFLVYQARCVMVSRQLANF